MKQVIQSFSTGLTEIIDLPSPNVLPGHLLIRTSCTLVSSGTERMLVNFAKSNLFDKALQQPDKVRQVYDKIGTDGLLPTLKAVSNKLSNPIPLGYCNVGVVVSVGDNVTGYKVGDRVVSNGPHAELVVVPHRLCSVIPHTVSDEEAVFTILASIGLQGVRLASPSLGETFVVSGLGLIGLLTCQLLKANGCKVLGMDPDPRQVAFAQSLGFDALDLSSDINPVDWCNELNSGIGIDAVLITASTSSSEPVHLAAQVCRQRGRIVLVGVTGLDIRRDLFYHKEISFQVSCSYGPGRYDLFYEELGHDYPIGFVRWTEQRNFHAILNLLNSSSFTTANYISHRFSLDKAVDAYQLLNSSEYSLGILLTYSCQADPLDQVSFLHSSPAYSFSDQVVTSVIGSGNFASRVLIPAFSRAGAVFDSIAASSGLAPSVIGKKFGFRVATTDLNSIFCSPSCDSIVIATRHNSHKDLIVQSLMSSKHVFVEKPLCLNFEELADIKKAYSGEVLLMVGFNRRFSPLVVELKTKLSSLSGPKSLVYTCNSGFIPEHHWIHDPSIGGGRLIGEACHFVDLARFLIGHPIIDLTHVSALNDNNKSDTFTLQIKFADGSIASIHYFSNGHKSFPKERIEVFSSGCVFLLDNFRRLSAWGVPHYRGKKLFSQNKGHLECCKAFLDAIKNGDRSPIPIDQIFEVQEFLLHAIYQDRSS